MTAWWLLLAVFVVSWVLTLFLRRYALAKSLMDIPNERSSHSIPMPRGGGVAIVVSFLLALPVLGGLDLLSSSALYGLLGSGLLVAIIGFADDHGHIAARWRLLGHFVAAIWALFWLNGLAPVQLTGSTVDLGWFGNVLAAFYLVWMLNLYNFMDGIDGLASVEAICVCLGSCLIYWLTGSIELVWPSLILAAAVTGFLCWNFPPARIFMGDAGSGFLGIVLAVLALQASWVSRELLWSWLVLLGVFIVDATWTLMRRLLRGEKVYQAHRSHAYQFASRRFGSHRVVTVAVLAINVLWLLPLAYFVAAHQLSGPMALVVAYAPLVGLAYKLGAGELERAV
jgi:Fuc2NAc and GlcNAc transferase